VKISKHTFGGILLLGLGIYGLISGKTLSLGKTEFIATRTDDFAGYWIVIALLFYFGFSGLKDGFRKKKENISSSELFKDNKEFLKFKQIEKSVSNTAMLGCILGFFCSFPIGFVTLFAMGIDGDSCIKCQKNGDWWGLIFFGSMIVLPVLFFKVFIKIKTTSLVRKGLVTKSELNKMQFFKDKYDFSGK
jgi:hypothetical protein